MGQHQVTNFIKLQNVLHNGKYNLVRLKNPSHCTYSGQQCLISSILVHNHGFAKVFTNSS